MKRQRDRQLRWSRVLLTVLGLVLLTISITGLLVATNVVDGIGEVLDSDTAILNDAAFDGLRDNELAWQLVGVASGLLLIGLGLVLLGLQVPRIRLRHDFRVENPDGEWVGSNIIREEAVTDFFEDELRDHPGVESARADYGAETNDLRLRLDIADGADVSRVIDDALDPALDHFRDMIGLEESPTIHADLRLVEPSGPRVR